MSWEDIVKRTSDPTGAYSRGEMSHSRDISPKEQISRNEKDIKFKEEFLSRIMDYVRGDHPSDPSSLSEFHPQYHSKIESKLKEVIPLIKESIKLEKKHLEEFKRGD
tara:strand:+ start:412 stop:732 length:321 start_codon:yes stop_codon:yes gene_type:complete